MARVLLAGGKSFLSTRPLKNGIKNRRKTAGG